MGKRTHSRDHLDFKGFDDYIEGFKAGTHIDNKGRTRTFTTADLDQVVANFDADHPVPHVITHKELYSPFAYAQTTDVKREGDSLLLKVSKVEPQFEKLVEEGRLYERSIRLMPTDKGWKLGHVAWLGAEPPAVAGLAPVQFSSGEDECYDFSVDTYTPGVLSRMMRRMREFLIEKFGVEQADKVLPDYDIDSLAEHATNLRDSLEADTAAPSFSAHKPNPGDPTMPPDFTQADIDAATKQGAKDARQQAEADFAKQQEALQQDLASERNQRLATEFNSAITELVDAGQLLPAQAEGVTEFMLGLADGDEAQFEFSVGDGDKASAVKKSPLQFFRDFMATLPKQVSTTESDAGDEHEGAGGDFAAPAGAHVDADRLDLHNKALDYQRNHDGVDYLDAVKTVEKKEG